MIYLEDLVYCNTLSMSCLRRIVVGKGKEKAKSLKYHAGIIIPTPSAMITPEPSQRLSQRTIFPLTLLESSSPESSFPSLKESDGQKRLLHPLPKLKDMFH